MTSDLTDIRKDLCRRGRSPKVSWDGEQYRRLSVQCVKDIDGCEGECVIRRLPVTMDKILAWLDRLEEMTGHSFIWQGEGLANLTLQIFKVLLKASRQNLTPDEKRAISLQQGGKCKMCEDAPICEYDHTTPVRASYTGSSQNFQGLCLACHAECTRYQSDAVRLDSQLSPYACGTYREQKGHPGLVHIAHQAQSEAHKKHMKLLDIVRCRFSAAAHYDLESFPCFCVFDNIQPFDITNPRLGDLNFIEPPSHKHVNVDESFVSLNDLPVTGPMWYSELEARHCLSHGIIDWSHFKATFRATGRIPRSAVESALAVMEAAWGTEEKLAKDSWNHAVGVMGGSFLERYHVVTTESQLPALGTKFKIVDLEDDRRVYDHITPIPLKSCESLKPFFDCIMGWEYTKVSALCYAIKRVLEPRNILQIQTDSVLMANTKRKAEELTKIEQMTYEDACRLSNPSEEGLHAFKKREIEVSYPIRKGDHGRIFQQKSAKLMSSSHKITRHIHLQTLSKVWREIPTPAENGRLNTDEVLRHVLNGHHLFIDGMPGAGKSELGIAIVNQLRAMKKTVAIIAKTNAACRRFGCDAVTADKWLNHHVKNAHGSIPNVLFIEEISMIDLRLWGYISTLFQLGRCQIIMAGDLFQIQPPKNTWCGVPVPKNALGGSDLLYQLAGGNKCFLDINMRSDPVIYEFAKSLRAPGVDLKERLQTAKQLFPPTTRIPDHVLVNSHNKRVNINKQCNDLKKPLGAMFLEMEKSLNCRDECLPQSMWVWVGMKLMGQKTVKQKDPETEQPRVICMKSQMYTVTRCNERTITVGTSDGTQSTIPTTKACEYLRLCDAITYQRAQGLTLSGVIVLADTEKPYFEITHLNVGVTRATHSSLVEIRDL